MWSESQMYEVYSSVGSGVDILKKKTSSSIWLNCEWLNYEL